MITEKEDKQREQRFTLRCINCALKFQVGLREIKNQTFDAVFPHFPILPYNRYLFTMAAFDKDETVGIAVADGLAVPKS